MCRLFSAFYSICLELYCEIELWEDRLVEVGFHCNINRTRNGTKCYYLKLSVFPLQAMKSTWFSFHFIFKTTKNFTFKKNICHLFIETMALLFLFFINSTFNISLFALIFEWFTFSRQEKSYQISSLLSAGLYKSGMRT